MSPTVHHRLPESLPPELSAILSGYHRRARFRRLARDLSCSLLLGGGLLLAFLLLDRFVDMEGKWRAPWPVLTTLLWTGLAGRILLRAVRRPDYDRIAWALDRSSGDARDHLRSVLDFASTATPASFFIRRTRQRAIQRWQAIDSAALTPTLGARAWLAAAILLIIGLAALAQVSDLRADLLWRRFWDPLGNHMRPSSTWFVVENLPAGPLRTGDDLRLRVALMGRKKEKPAPLLRFQNADGTSATRSLAPTPDGYWQTELQNLKQDLTWHLFMEDARSEQYGTRVLPRPTILQTEVTYHYPEYALMKDKSEVLIGRTLTALEGTRIQLKITCNLNLIEALGIAEEETRRFRINRQNPREAILHLIVTKNVKIRPDLASHDQVRSKEELPFNVRAVPDNAPTVSIKNQGLIDGKSFYLSDFIELDYRSQDDLGLSELYLRAEAPKDRYPDGPVSQIDIPLDEHGTRLAEGQMRLPVSDLAPGDVDEIRLRLVTLDTKEQEATSPTATLRIASDSFDRQIRFLFKSYRGDPGQHAPETRGEPSLAHHERILSALKAARSKMAILLNALEDQEAIGPNHAEIVQQLQTEVQSIGTPFPYGTYWFFDFQNAAFLPRFRYYGEYAVLWARLASGAPQLRQLLAQALSSSPPKAALQKLADRIDHATEHQAEIHERVRGDYRDSARELTGYLLSAWLQSRALADEPSWRNPAFAASLKERLKEILVLAESELRQECPETTLQALKLALEDKDLRSALTPLDAPLDEWRQTLLARAREAAVRRYRAGLSLHPPVAMPAAPDRGFTSALASALFLASDNVGEDDVFILQTSFAWVKALAGSTGTEGSFQPLGDPDGRVREREEDAFQLFQLLQRARGRAEELRLGLASGKLRFGQPETEALWLAHREDRFALRAWTLAAGPAETGVQQAVREILASSDAFEDWRLPLDPRSLGFELGRWELKCRGAAALLLPQVRSLLEKINRDLSARQGQLADAIGALRNILRDEMAYLEKSQDSIGINGLRTIKVHLAGLRTAALKTLDFAELARIHHVQSALPIEFLAGVNLLLGKTIQDFERKVEAKAAHHATSFGDIYLQSWSVRIQEYQALDGFLGSLSSVLSASDPAGLEALISGQNLEYQSRQDREALHAALSAEGRLAEAGKLLGDLLLDSEDASSLWAELFYQLQTLHDGLRREASREALLPRVARVEQALKRLDPLPKELELVSEFLSESRTPEARAEVASRYDAWIEELKALAQAPERRIQQRVQDFYGWIQAVDLSAMARARIRSQRQIVSDRRWVKRTLSALALGWEGACPADLYGALGEGELNRRKASITFDRIGLGGMALSSDGLENLKLPKHLYRELERARSGPMPQLFKKDAYEYLNRVLQNAR
ncbi:MAG: hypothetical protein HYU36_11475 [Planctomycetes bacterium]|nr:hypothetical protein [Planctomycetota bacterium]